MGADGVDAVTADGVVPFDDQIGGITLETLHKAAVAARVTAQPAAGCDRIAQFVLRTCAASAAGGARRNEVVHDRVKSSQSHPGDRPEGQQIHELPAAHSGHITCWHLSHG